MEKVDSVVQATLFELPPAVEAVVDSRTAFNDPTFSSNKSIPIHRWVPWIAGFSRQFVQGALERYLPKKGTVLDPFAGVGTTLVEAILSGHNAIGFEINPYAAFACRTKLNAYTFSSDAVRKATEEFEVFYGQSDSGQVRTPK